MSGISAVLDGSFGTFRLRVDLELPPAGVSVVFGPSGCGKTTLLRCLAGLEPLVRGRVALGDVVWQDDEHGLFLPAHQRRAAYVFQDAALFPHLTVRQNLEYGYRRTPPEQRRVPFSQPVELLGIGHLLARRPGRLSGGERQRVAIARALLASPRLLLMDEPLAALDVARKREVLPFLETLHRELSIPMVYVTHSPDEAARLGDHLVLMADGALVAQGPLQTLLGCRDSGAGSLAEIGTVIDARIQAHDRADSLSCLAFAGGQLWVAERPEAVGEWVRCRILPEDVSLALAPPPASSILNILPAGVLAVSDTAIPGHVQVLLQLGETRLVARITRRSSHVLGLHPGQPVFAQIKSVTLTSESHAD